MKNSYFVLCLAFLFLTSICFMIGCGSNATGGGGSTPGDSTKPLSADIYVSNTGSDETGTGTSELPYKTIQKAMNVASSNDVIGVFSGVYKEHITWSTRENITLRGESENTVIISGEGTGRCIYLPSGAGIPPNQTATIEYVTIRNGSADALLRGSGIFHRADDVTLNIRNCMITLNQSHIAGVYGGGLAVANAAKIRAENCIFASNEAVYGGAICVEHTSQVYLKNCIFYANTCDTSGGAIWGFVGDNYLTVEKCIFSNNNALGYGGCLYFNGNVMIVNSVFYNNKALGGSGGALALTNTSQAKTVINCTVVSNEASTIGGGINGLSSTSIVNTICWGNKSGTDPSTDDLKANATNVRYTDMKKWPAGITGRIGTTDADPVFSGNPPYDDPLDFILNADTAVSTGGTDEADMPATDIRGNLRTPPYSMGAYEKD